MSLVIQVTLGIFMFYKCEISSKGDIAHFTFLVHIRAAKYIWRKKSLLYSFSATDRENH
jgi:hypothetical protein